MSTLKVNKLTNVAGNADVTNVGKLVQYKVSKKTDGASTTNTTVAGNEISSDFRITLTPQNASNIIYVQAFLSLTVDSTSTMNIKLYRNTASDFSGTSTLVMPETGGTSGNQNVDGNMNLYNGGGGFMGGFAICGFETAGNTNARTYSPFWAIQATTAYLNQWSSTTSYFSTSTFAVMEIVQ